MVYHVDPQGKLQSKACLSPNERVLALASLELAVRVKAAPLPNRESRDILYKPAPRQTETRQLHSGCLNVTVNRGLFCFSAERARLPLAERALHIQGTGSKRMHIELQRTG